MESNTHVPDEREATQQNILRNINEIYLPNARENFANLIGNHDALDPDFKIFTEEELAKLMEAFQILRK